MFVFEGEEVEWAVDDLVDAQFSPAFQAALAAWRPLVEEPPRIARLVYAWERGGLVVAAAAASSSRPCASA